MRTSPLHEAHGARGAKLTPFGGWEMPLSYPAGTIAEHVACRRSAVVFDVSHLGTVRVHGPGAFERLQGALTNDLAKIRPGRAQYTHLCDDEGSVLDDIIVWWVAEDVFDVMPNASNTERVVAAVGGTDTTSQRAVLAVQGPEARSRLAAVCPEAAAVGRFRVASVAWGDVPLTVAGTGYTGEDGVEVAVPAGSARALWEAIVAAGVGPAGLGARDTLRLEAGLPLHGHELGPGITPLQAGLGWVVGWGKPAFPGKAALEAERAAGPARLLRGIATEGRRPPRADQQVMAGGDGEPAGSGGKAQPAGSGGKAQPAGSGGKAQPAGSGGKTRPVGIVTSGNFSPVLGHGIALAFLRPDVEPGDAVVVAARGAELAGRVVPLPFVARGGSGG